MTFVHGWGCGPDIWDNIISKLPNIDINLINLGYTGEEKLQDSDTDKSTIYVTHSFGTMWALKHRTSNMKALIAINGFTCFQNFTTPRTLKTMQRNLQRTPETQMQDFWSTTALPHHKHFNTDALMTGLDWLTNMDCSDVLSSLSCPISSLYGDNDPILATDTMQKMWAGHASKIIKNGGHNLPAAEPKICSEFITECLNER